MGIGQHIPRFIDDKATSFRRESATIMSTHPHNAFYLRPSRTREQEHHKMHHHSNDTHGDLLLYLKQSAKQSVSTSIALGWKGGD